MLRGETGLAALFDEYEDSVDPRHGTGFADQQRRPGTVTLGFAARWIDAHAGAPFFYLFHIYEPHGPFPHNTPDPEKSALFLYLNANKLGITLDVESATGASILKELLKHAEIFIEDKPPAAMEQLGFSYPRIREISPRTIHVSLTPFGQSGPYRDYKGYAINCSALGGQSVCAGEPGREPLTPPLSLGHYQSGAAAAAAAMAALLASPLAWAELTLGDA